MWSSVCEYAASRWRNTNTVWRHHFDVCLMFDHLLRDLKENVLVPLALILARYISATQITLIGFIFGILSVLFIPQYFYLANIFWWLNRLCDGVDGVIARVSNTQTDLGGYLDICFDFIIYAAIPISIAHSNPHIEHLMLVVAIMEGMYFVNAALLFHGAALCEKRALDKRKGNISGIYLIFYSTHFTHFILSILIAGRKTSVSMPPALVEGFETMMFYGAFLALPQHAMVLFCLFASLVFVTILQRIHWGVGNLN